MQAEILGGRLEREPVERQRAEVDHLAGLVHRLVGGQVGEVDRRGQPDLAGQLDGVAAAPAFLRAETSMPSDRPGWSRTVGGMRTR